LVYRKGNIGTDLRFSNHFPNGMVPQYEALTQPFL
jgi:hypothetical protein